MYTHSDLQCECTHIVIYNAFLKFLHDFTAASGDGDMSILGDHVYQPGATDKEVKFKVTRGDYSPLMNLLCDNLNSAKVCVKV